MTPALLAPTIAPLSHLLGTSVEANGVRRVLRTVRKHLHMDVAFVTRFESHDRVFEHVDDDDGRNAIVVGQRLALKDGYCLKIARGELPACIPDTSTVAAALDMPETTALPIGSHLGVPVQLESGEIYGSLCCFSYAPNRTLGERDVQLMQAFAEVLAARIDENQMAERLQRRTADEITALIDRGAPRIVHQPIFRLDDGRLSGFECLSRFDGDTRRRPDEWFNAAHRAGVGLDLESRAIANALATQPEVPRGTYLAINASAAMLLSDRLAPLLSTTDLTRTVVELTEHAIVDDYDSLAAALRPWRRRGLRLAVDDAGAGYSSMRHILQLDPDIIKLDMSLTHDIDCDPKRRALAKGLTTFAHDIGCLVIAEGVETENELAVLRELNVDKAQGYLLARPEPLELAMLGATLRSPT